MYIFIRQISINQPLSFLLKHSLELVAHEAVDDEVRGGIENEKQVHEAGEAEEPGRGCHIGAAEHNIDENIDINDETVLPSGIVCHEELSTVDDQSWEVTEKKHDDNSDEDSSKIHLVMSRIVVVRPHMGVPAQNISNESHIKSKSPYFIPLNILTLKYTSKPMGRIPVRSSRVQLM